VAIFLTCVKNQYNMFISNCFKFFTYIFFLIFVQIKLKFHSWRVFKGIHVGYKESYKIWSHLKEHILSFYLFNEYWTLLFSPFKRVFHFISENQKNKFNSLLKLYDKIFYLIINLVLKQSCTMPHLFMKQCSMFCFVCHVEISQTMMLHAMLLVSSKSSWWEGVHWFGLRMFGAIVWKLLIIEPFFQWKLNKIKSRIFIWIWRRCWKALVSQIK